jgi:hypothetical protein
MKTTGRVRLAVSLPILFLVLLAYGVTGSSAAGQPVERASGWSDLDNRIFTTPAEPGVKPSVARQDVRSHYAKYRTHEPDLIELVRYRDDVYGDIQTDGSVRLRHRNTLAWALVHKSVQVPFYGGIGSIPPPQRVCDQIDVMDAHTGTMLVGFFDCTREGEKPAR